MKMKQFIAEHMPEELNIYLQMRKTRKHWISANLIFIHVPKNAGVSLAHAIYGRPMGHWTVKQLLRHHPDLCDKIPMITVVRNPCDRLLSAYRFAKQGFGHGVIGGPVVMNQKYYQRPAFRTFESFVCEWLPNATLNKCDFIFRSQTSFLVDKNDHIRPNHIFELEKIDEIELFLTEHLKRNTKLKRMNYTVNDGSIKISKEMEDIIRSAYADDFANFYPTW